MKIKYIDRRIFFRLLHYIKGQRVKFIVAIISTFVIVALNMIPPYIIGETIGTITDGTFDMGQKINIINKWIIILVISYFLSKLISYVSQMLLQAVGQNVIYKIRQEAFEKIETLSLDQLSKTSVGRLVTIVTNDTNSLNTMFTEVLAKLLNYILSIIYSFILMTQISPFLTLILCATIPALLIITMIFKKFSTVCYRNVRKNIAELNGFLSENLSGMKVIQSFVQENKKKKEFSKCNQDYKKSNMKQIMLFAIYRPGIYCLYIFTQALIIFVGAKQIISGRLQLKNYVKFYNYIGDFYTPIQNLAEQINELQAAFAAAERIFAMIDMKTDITDGVNAVECENIKGKIEFSHVWFKYGQEDWVLKDISFTVNAGDTCAIVGETGSGKSTILSLLVRNYEIQKGSIYLDGVDITNYKIDSLRKQIGQMLQTVFLFSGSISDNITMLDDTISEQQIKEATSYVCADSFIEKYEDGYDHAIVEKGANLSEGQQQLISFARTIVHSPPIMVLDEATSNIDTETEFIIQKSLDNIKSVGTVLVVAHRLSTIKGANQIIVMNKGRISEFGNHNELINKRGIYYRLYQLQW